MSAETAKPTIVVPPRARPGLFEAVGVEIEYMIVDTGTLDVAPVCDELMEAVAGEPASEVEMGELAWSNELALHVLEIKTNGPAPGLSGLDPAFHASVLRANRELAATGRRLMPGAVHPWMDPAAETELWPHEYTEVYHAFDRIFGCSGHGWSNLQSTHLNLPFHGDDEFGRLHAAVRLVLPLIPGLSSASPYLDGARAPQLDARLAAYRGNARRIPSVTGLVVPEPAFSRAQYEEEILGRIWADLAPWDPDGILRHEWVNARGAIARFDRGTVEVRVIDAQECPTADLAVLAAVTSVVRALAVGPLAARDPLDDPDTAHLADLLDKAIVHGEGARVDHPGLLRVLGHPGEPVALGSLWGSLLDRFPPHDPGGEWGRSLETILERGTLARRMTEAVGPGPDRETLRALARTLCGCLEEDTLFRSLG